MFAAIRRASSRVNSLAAMSALPPIADIVERDRDVRFVPKADISHLFDHLVGASQHGAWNREAEGLCGPKIDDKLEMGRCLKRQISRPRSA
jgi:hypothetical protein